MQSIIFRGIGRLTQDWEYGAYTRFLAVDGNVYDAIVPEGDRNEYVQYETISIIPETLGQFIWIRDTNGMKVFTGDIVKDRNDKLFVICQVPGGFALQRRSSFNGNVLTTYSGLGDMQSSSWFQRSLEVVGNVYENKDLLEVF